jgi:very-short-patch-repair endonuclease
MKPEIRRARDLRRNMSEPEVILWSRLKRLRSLGFHIRRQFPFRGYCLDFACLSRRLVIEVDGAQHGDDAGLEHDAIRDRVLGRAGFRVLRVWAREVRSDAGGVMDRIVAALEAAPSVRGARQSAQAEPEPHLPTLTAARSVPPH